MKEKIRDILRGKFLVNEDAVKNWRFMLFLAVLALVMISSSHNAENKVHYLAKLDKKVKELRSEYVDLRSNLMKLKMESTVVKKMEARGLLVSDVPPKMIKVTEEN